MMKNEYKVNLDGTVTIYLQEVNGKRLETLISSQDFEIANSVNGTWYGNFMNNNQQYYVAVNLQKDLQRQRIYLHRLIMKPRPGYVIDHMNHDSLNNTRENLRELTPTENMQNAKGATSRSKSGIRGVSQRPNGKWMASMKVNYQYHYLGIYDDVREAEEAAIKGRIMHMAGYLPPKGYEYLIEEVQRERGLLL